MSVSHQQLIAFLEQYQGRDVTAKIEELAEARSAVHISNGDWSESDVSPGVARAFCEGLGIKIGKERRWNNKIGSYTPETDESEAIIEREWYGQGYIFKDDEAFYNHLDKVCYVPELHDGGYTRQDFLDLVNGRVDFAEELYFMVDWQSPETLLNEWVPEEWDACPKCGWFYSSYDVHEKVPPVDPHCEKCGANLEELVEIETKKGEEQRNG
jgi:hypothetical protein